MKYEARASIRTARGNKPFRTHLNSLDTLVRHVTVPNTGSGKPMVNKEVLCYYCGDHSSVADTNKAFVYGLMRDKVTR